MKKNDIPMLGVKREENDNKAFSNQKGGTMKKIGWIMILVISFLLLKSISLLVFTIKFS